MNKFGAHLATIRGTGVKVFAVRLNYRWISDRCHQNDLYFVSSDVFRNCGMYIDPSLLRYDYVIVQLSNGEFKIVTSVMNKIINNNIVRWNLEPNIRWGVYDFLNDHIQLFATSKSINQDSITSHLVKPGDLLSQRFNKRYAIALYTITSVEQDPLYKFPSECHYMGVEYKLDYLSPRYN